jgi:hypothetical protein
MNRHVAAYRPQSCSSGSRSSVRNVNCHVATNRVHLNKYRTWCRQQWQCGWKACGVIGALGLHTVRCIHEWLRCAEARYNGSGHCPVCTHIKTCERLKEFSRNLVLEDNIKKIFESFQICLKLVKHNKYFSWRTRCISVRICCVYRTRHNFTYIGLGIIPHI